MSITKTPSFLLTALPLALLVLALPFAAVGTVYCLKCSDVNTTDVSNSKPLAGATVNVFCNHGSNYYVTSGNNGRYKSPAGDFNSNCFARIIVGSTGCSVPTNVNKGSTTGARMELKLSAEEGGLYFAVQPVAFKEDTC